MIEVSEAAEELLPRIDGLLFDMDGVLLDITHSIRPCCCLTVPFYLREIRGWAAGDDLVTPAEIELFKNAGGFNDDTQLVAAIILHYLVKEHEHPGSTAETLSVFQPSVARFAARVAERGGGLAAAEKACLEGLTFDDRTVVQAEYRKDIITRVFMEHFAGEESMAMYGAPAKYYHGPGLWKHDRPLIDHARLDRASAGRHLGILTGRTRGESVFGMRVAELEDVIPADHIVTPEDAPTKPGPQGLRKLVERLDITAGLYIGDTRDDFQTVLNYRKAYPDSPMLGALVLTGPMGDANARIFRRTRADVIASDVNEVLRWVAG
ncbi:MAG: HAD family hydrolase [Capsulimonadaceae bacterium]